MGAAKKVAGGLLNPLGAIGDLTGLSPQAPKVPRLPPPVTDIADKVAPNRTSSRVQQAAIVASQAASGGYGSTVATSPTGLLKPATTTRKTLLGA